MRQDTITPGRRALRTFLVIMALFAVYAFAVQATDVSLDKLRDPARRVQLIGVLRALANPDLAEPDLLDAALGGEPGPIEWTSTTIDTLRLIVETIFIALMATTLGTILAVPVSFLAARNLMIEITAPAAAIMAGIIALPLGAAVGYLLARALLGLAALVGASGPGVASLAGVLAILWLLNRWRPPAGAAAFWLGGLRLLLMAGLGLLTFGLLSLLGVTAGTWLADILGPFNFVGNFVVIVAEAIGLLLAPALALLGGLIGASLGSRYGQEAIIRLDGLPVRLLTLALSFGGGAVLIYGIGATLNWLYQFDNPQNWTTLPALIGGAAIALLSLSLPPKHPFAIGAVIYAVSRSVLNVLRSIEPLIMAVVFVIWVGLGPFAGVMALTLHTIAALGKLYSEQIEGIAEGPIEAITATGASRLQIIVYGVIPQIVPPYIAYTLYRWDINVRMSTILGFVGGGGIGFLLSQSIRLLAYRSSSVMMLAIAIVVSSLDYLSARIRQRII